MNYAEAKYQLDKSNIEVDVSSYTTITNDNYNNGGIASTSYLLIDITISNKEKLDDIKLLKQRLLNEGALKHLGIFDNEDLDIFLTFYYDGKAHELKTLVEYLAFLRDNQV